MNRNSRLKLQKGVLWTGTVAVSVWLSFGGMVYAADQVRTLNLRDWNEQTTQVLETEGLLDKIARLELTAGSSRERLDTTKADMDAAKATGRYDAARAAWLNAFSQHVSNRAALFNSRVEETSRRHSATMEYIQGLRNKIQTMDGTDVKGLMDTTKREVERNHRQLQEIATAYLDEISHDRTIAEQAGLGPEILADLSEANAGSRQIIADLGKTPEEVYQGTPDEREPLRMALRFARQQANSLAVMHGTFRQWQRDNQTVAAHLLPMVMAMSHGDGGMVFRASRKGL